ncbi:pilus assembly protein [Jannaschia sp. 2305UL9-9]|uniref:pilus assembly protein n=1 Tax=Jannaschia sp. 2305UL9-9 TaxID=3121638 RepID=UPI0035275F02
MTLDKQTLILAQFIHDESGAVTVDWVVLTAALVGLGLAVMGVISGGIESLSNDINDVLLVDHTEVAF